MILLALVGAIASCGSGEEEASTRGRPPTPVVVSTPFEYEFADRVEALGTARANESLVITARVMETVEAIRFEDGQQVEAGAILAVLERTEEAAQLSEARANLADARLRFERVAGLAERGTESQSRYDEVRTALEAAEARVAELEARVSDRSIRAPFAGVLGLREVSPGTLVQPGDHITTLDDIDRIKVDFSVPETFLSILEPELEVRTRSAAYPTREFVGRIRAIDSRVDPRTRAIRVRAEIENADHAIRPGMLLTLVLRANPRRSLAISEAALVPRGSSQFVVVVGEDGSTRRVEVQTGRRVPGIVELRSGLDADARVVIDGASLIPPGGMVRVLEEQPPPSV
ncbi:MAG: efflux RND transporter periplasmic adaptor subunit [Deltaproteobacteria bacterium]|nr:efflux RND transporter periplasmic adaptor subunit [Deltaproteobacteria bacterium]